MLFNVDACGGPGVSGFKGALKCSIEKKYWFKPLEIFLKNIADLRTYGFTRYNEYEEG